MKQTYTLFEKQWKDYFDFIKINLVLPEIVCGNRYISDDLFYRTFFEGRIYGYYISLNNKIGLSKDYNCWEFNLIILGLGLNIKRRWTY
jgi:hypothetical protein